MIDQALDLGLYTKSFFSGMLSTTTFVQLGFASLNRFNKLSVQKHNGPNLPRRILKRRHLHKCKKQRRNYFPVAFTDRIFKTNLSYAV